MNNNKLAPIIIVGLGNDSDAILKELQASLKNHIIFEENTVDFLKIHQLPNKIDEKIICLFFGDSCDINTTNFSDKVICLDVTDAKICHLANDHNTLNKIRCEFLLGLCSFMSDNNMIGIDFIDIYSILKLGKNKNYGYSCKKDNMSPIDVAKKAIQSIDNLSSALCGIYINIIGDISLADVQEIAEYLDKQLVRNDVPFVYTSQYNDSKEDFYSITVVVLDN